MVLLSTQQNTTFSSKKIANQLNIDLLTSIMNFLKGCVAYDLLILS
jgi:hypothetical protein